MQSTGGIGPGVRMFLPVESEAGSAGDATVPTDRLVDSLRRYSSARKFFFRALPKTHWIGRRRCPDTRRPENGILTNGDPLSPFQGSPAHV